MTFHSYLFLLLFFPMVLVGYYLCRGRRKAADFVLLAASGVFYCWTGWRAACLLLADILLNYGFFRRIQWRREHGGAGNGKRILWFGIACNLVILGYFKYYNFFVDNVNLFLGTDFGIKDIILPMGISFITFQQIAFLVDTERGETAPCSLADYALFVSFFPHVGSGPIILHSDFFPLLQRDRHMDWDRFAQGIYMFAMGLGKKVLIADVFGQAVDLGYSDLSVLNRTSLLFVSVAYTLQIYFDFSGYSDMAVGISRMLQLDLPINFDSPYKSGTIVEFWRRWHMTLTGFLTKYVYIPLGGGRKGKLRTYLNTMFVFLCSGLWHGASWTFLLWGGMHGLFMVLTKHFHKMIDRIPRILCQGITLLFLNFTWIVFRAGSFTVLKQMADGMLHNTWGRLDEKLCGFFVPVVLEDSACPVRFCAVLFMLAAVVIVLKCKNVQERAECLTYSVRSCVWVLAVMLLSVLSLSGMSTFVYSLF